MIEIILFSFLLGTGYALISAGFNLLLGVARIINLAYGASIVLVAYIYSYIASMLPKLTAALLTIAITTLLGTFGWIILNWLRKNEMLMIVVSLSIALLIEGILLWTFGPYQRIVPLIFEGNIGVVPLQWIFTIFTAALVLGCYYYVVNKTKIGKQIRATSENQELSLLFAINPNKVFLFTAFLAALFGTIGSLMISPFLTIYPHVAWFFLAIVLSVSILGGLGSVAGALIAGYLISFAERFSAYYLDPSIQAFVPVIIIIAVLLIRPQGIFGKKQIRWA